MSTRAEVWKEATRVLRAGSSLGILPRRIMPSDENGIGITYLTEDSKRLYIEVCDDLEIVFGLDSKHTKPEVWVVTSGELEEPFERARAFLNSD